MHCDPMVRLRQSRRPASAGHGLIRGVIFVLAVGLVCSDSIRTKDAMAADQLRAELSITDPESGEFYRSHTRIGLAAGTSFLIPSEWQGVLPPGSRTFYLESPKSPGIGLVAVIQDATPEELEDHLNEPQVIEEGYVLQPLASAQRAGPRITAAYHSGDNIGRAIAVFGPSPIGILYLFAGPKDQLDYYDRLLEEIVASTQFDHVEGKPTRTPQGM
jgi:hypothetical protein